MKTGKAKPLVSSGGIEWIMCWGTCSCKIWEVALFPGTENAGRCGYCKNAVKYMPVGMTYEQVLDRYRHDYGRDPVN